MPLSDNKKRYETIVGKRLPVFVMNPCLLVVVIPVICIVLLTTFYITRFAIDSKKRPYDVEDTDLEGYNTIRAAEERPVASAPLVDSKTFDGNDNTLADSTDSLPPPSYNEVIATGDYSCVARENNIGPVDLEWHHVFSTFNEQRMTSAALWTPLPKSKRQLKKNLQQIDNFLGSETHPVSAQLMLAFLKSFNVLTNLVYSQSTGSDERRINITWHSPNRDVFMQAFSLLMTKYVPNEPIVDRVVPYGYDWFVFSGRMTYAIVNAHITLCTVDREEPRVRPYYSQNPTVGTRAVAKGLKNVCANFTDSLGYERYSSNRVYIATAFLYASLLEKVCLCLAEKDLDLPPYVEALNEILYVPSNRYDSLNSLIREIGKSDIPAGEEADTGQKHKKSKQNVPAGAERGEATYDGIYEDRTFIAHRRLRMYSYIRSYCEQVPSLLTLLREKRLDEVKTSAILRAVEPMSAEGGLFYFNLHSRTGTFKYRSGWALFTALAVSRFRSDEVASYGRVYVADKARILFVQSGAFTFHAIGQLSDLAYGEVEKANRDLMPAWLMGQRPLFRSEKYDLVDVPCSAHLEPCVIDTGKSKDLQLDPIKKRNTTDYTPTEASSAIVAFEEQNIGAVFTYVREINMDVHFSRCTVATPYYAFTTYFRITRNHQENDVPDNGQIQLSCYTGAAAVEDDANVTTDGNDVIASQREFNFKHCTVRVLVQGRDGKDYGGKSVTLSRREPIAKRTKSKSKYSQDELRNVSLTLTPYGYDGASTQLPGSVTILYRPKSSEAVPVPPSLASRTIAPAVSVEEDSVFRVQVDSRYVLYCDGVRNIIVLLDVHERRACIAPVYSTIKDSVREVDRVDLIKSASVTLQRLDGLGSIKYDSICNNRIYAYFDDK